MNKDCAPNDLLFCTVMSFCTHIVVLKVSCCDSILRTGQGDNTRVAGLMKAGHVGGCTSRCVVEEADPSWGVGG